MASRGSLVLQAGGDIILGGSPIDQVKDELLLVQLELIRTQRNEAQFRELSGYLVIALARSQGVHHRLMGERDKLRARAEASGAVDRDAYPSNDQVARVRRQLDQARARTLQAEELVKDLRTRYAELSARWAELEATSAIPVPPSSASPIPSETGALPGGGSLADDDVVLDLVDDLLAEGGQDLARTRDWLTHDDQPVDPDFESSGDPEVVLPESAADDPHTWPAGASSPASDTRGVGVLVSGYDASTGTESVNPAAWLPLSKPGPPQDVESEPGDLQPPARLSDPEPLYDDVYYTRSTVGSETMMEKAGTIALTFLFMLIVHLSIFGVGFTVLHHDAGEWVAYGAIGAVLFSAISVILAWVATGRLLFWRLVLILLFAAGSVISAVRIPNAPLTYVSGNVPTFGPCTTRCQAEEDPPFLEWSDPGESMEISTVFVVHGGFYDSVKGYVTFSGSPAPECIMSGTWQIVADGVVRRSHTGQSHTGYEDFELDLRTVHRLEVKAHVTRIVGQCPVAIYWRGLSSVRAVPDL